MQQNDRCSCRVIGQVFSLRLIGFLVRQCDQVKNGVPGCDDKQMKDYCQLHGFDAWFETSAKDNINIEEAARFLIARVSIVLMSVGLMLKYSSC